MNRNLQKELIRKIVHITAGTIGILNIKFEIISLPIIFFLAFTFFGVFLYINFINTPRHLERPMRVFERDNGLKGQGPITLMIAYLFLHSIAHFSTTNSENALASMAIVTYGDTASWLFGIAFRKPKLPYNQRKSFIGLIMGSLTAILASAIFVPWIPALLVSIIAIIIESFDIKLSNWRVDDNLLIPSIAMILLLILNIA